MCPSTENIKHNNHNVNNFGSGQLSAAAQATEAKRIAYNNTSRDTYVPASLEDAAAKALMEATEQEARPSLSDPTTPFSGLGDDPIQPDSSMSLIAIIGQVLILQAKTNSNFWSTLWKQSSESMMAQIKMAPIISTAVASAYNQQSEATKANADQAKKSSMINITAFGATALMGGFLASKMPSEPLNQNPVAAVEESLEKDTGKAAAKGGSAAAKAGYGLADAATEELDAEVNTQTQTAEKAAATNAQSDLAKNTPSLSWKKNPLAKLAECANNPIDTVKGMGKGLMKAGGKGGSLLSKWLESSGKASSFIQLGTQGADAANTSSHQGQVATHQGMEGTQQATSKMAEQVAQFYGQVFSRSEDVRQGSQQGIDYAMNILKSASDTTTQVVNAMFRG